MSSFLCEYETIARAAHAGDVGELGESFHELVLLNADGYGQRYADNPETEAECTAFCEGSATFSPHAVRRPTRAHAYLALACVLYQANEGDVDESASYRKWDDLLDQLAHEIANVVADAEGCRWNA